MRVPEVRVVKRLDNGFYDGLVRHVGFIPRLDNEVDCVLDDHLGNLAGRLVQNQVEMVLRIVSLASAGDATLTFDKNECEGSEAFQSFHTSYWSCESMTA